MAHGTPPRLAEPAAALTTEEAEYDDYWDSMQLAYNYDRLEPENEGGAHVAAFLRLAGPVPWEAGRQAEEEAEPEVEP